MSDFVKELNFDGDTFNDMKRDICLTATAR